MFGSWRRSCSGAGPDREQGEVGLKARNGNSVRISLFSPTIVTARNALFGARMGQSRPEKASFQTRLKTKSSYRYSLNKFCDAEVMLSRFTT